MQLTVKEEVNLGIEPSSQLSPPTRLCYTCLTATLLQSTGVEFPQVTTFWAGDKYRSVGAGVRKKKFGFIPVKVPMPPFKPADVIAGQDDSCKHASQICCGRFQTTEPLQVYAVTLYVEAEKAARELGVRSRGGFFADDADEDYALALVDGAFSKALVVQLVRKVDGETFYSVRRCWQSGLGL